MVMIEAMALGCPVISFARGAAPELIVHGKAGFLVQDVDEMVRSMVNIDTIDRSAARLASCWASQSSRLLDILHPPFSNHRAVPVPVPRSDLVL